MPSEYCSSQTSRTESSVLVLCVQAFLPTSTATVNTHNCLVECLIGYTYSTEFSLDRITNTRVLVGLPTCDESRVCRPLWVRQRGWNRFDIKCVVSAKKSPVDFHGPSESCQSLKERQVKITDRVSRSDRRPILHH